MTEQEIIEGNKLIAEFMNIQNTIPLGIRLFGYPVVYLKLNYHTDWRFLMNVVEKINTLNPNSDGSEQFEVTIQHNFCEINRLWCGNIQGRWKSGLYNKLNTIESVWNCCVDFIKWFNTVDKTNLNESK